MKDYLNYRLDERSEVSDTELRVIVKLLLEHLKLDAVRYYGDDNNYGFREIVLEPEDES